MLQTPSNVRTILILTPSIFLSLQSDLPDLLISPLLMSPPPEMNNNPKYHSFFFHSFCQGALSGFHQATLFFSRWTHFCSHHSSPLLHQPRAGRTTCFLPKLPFRVFNSSQDLICLFLTIFGFFFFFLRKRMKVRTWRSRVVPVACLQDVTFHFSANSWNKTEQGKYETNLSKRKNAIPWVASQAAPWLLSLARHWRLLTMRRHWLF